ncbi:nitronate monooxygenase [Rothia sp. P100]|uniref:nitronate monooxygenase n=1 Tax=Rothia sp. P100 TaxID=2939578 RepID=UPI00203BEF5D|nr:nitronate monooxygenase [Rothia sp. P100]MCM3509191.1 nitronate monooxygenase [Rothia sp. P100]
MFSFADLEIPLVGAPMAGGPSTPQLAAVVSNAGGLGMLAAGYLNADQLAEQVKQTRELTDGPFGVNLFCPADPNDNPGNAKALLQGYRQALAPLGKQYGLDLLNYELVLPDHFHSLLDWLLANPVPVVTFTFGCPSAEQIERLQMVSTYVGVTVTNPQNAILATQADANFLCVQGPDAGGHQSTFRVQDEVNQLPLSQLVPAVQAVTNLPLIAGGGVGSNQDVQSILALGVEAVQVGTVLLLSDEAGTSQAHRDALQSGITETRLTRAFTGRPARAIVNDFVTEFDALAPAVYPHAHYLTAPLRAKAKDAGAWQHINAWTGTGFCQAHNSPTIKIIFNLLKPS